eukprot:scaffold2355_cov68-Skeletonema_dohrnii-CCMP3373.AAC.2
MEMRSGAAYQRTNRQHPHSFLYSLYWHETTQRDNSFVPDAFLHRAGTRPSATDLPSATSRICIQWVHQLLRLYRYYISSSAPPAL